MAKLTVGPGLEEGVDIGPLVVAFDDAEEVIEIANDTIFGLVSYVFGSTGRALAVAQRIDSGMVGVNRGFISGPAAPFGGMKQSGIGREGGREGILEYMESKYVSLAME